MAQHEELPEQKLVWGAPPQRTLAGEGEEASGAASGAASAPEPIGEDGGGAAASGGGEASSLTGGMEIGSGPASEATAPPPAFVVAPASLATGSEARVGEARLKQPPSG